MKEENDDGLIPELAVNDIERMWKQAKMPPYEMKNLQPFQSLTVHFNSLKDREEFAKRVGNPITPNTKFIWFPHVPPNKYSDRPPRPIKNQVPNKYPICVISKGRWQNPLTAMYLELLSIPYHLVIEPQELKHYQNIVWPWGDKIDPKRILTLPTPNYGKGNSINARNWVWRRSVQMGAKRHWVLDDNIQGFYCMNYNTKHLVGGIPKKGSGWKKNTNPTNPFAIVEQFTDSFDNVGISGMNYEFMLQHRSAVAPFYVNTRVYSCILINNALNMEWRGIYNEDTDLCLRVLKEGWCTILMNYVQAKKVPTGTMGGGNTDSIYRDWEEGRKEMAMSLKAQHPDIVTVTRKWGRWQHHVDYTVFKQQLRRIHAGQRLRPKR